MTSVRASRIHRGLIAALVTIYIVAAVAGLFVGSDDTGDKALWILFLGGGAALILIGAFVRSLPPSLCVSLVSVGAIAGGIALLWTVLVPLAAAILVAMTFALYRQPRPA